MAMEAPNDIGAGKKASGSNDNTDSSGAPHWSETFANAPLQTYCHGEAMAQKTYFANLFSWLQRGLTARIVEQNDSSSGTHSRNITKHENAIHHSFANFLRGARSQIQTLPRDRSLQVYYVLLLFGDFFAERVAYRAKMARNEPLTFAEIKTPMPHPSSTFNHAMDRIYVCCLHTTPEDSKAELPIPRAAQELICEFTKTWPMVMTGPGCRLPNAVCVPSVEQWAWPATEEDGVSESEIFGAPSAFGCSRRRGAGPAGLSHLTSTDRAGAEDNLRGTMTWIMLGSEAEAIRFMEIGRTAAYLLDGLVYPGDCMVKDYVSANDGERFFELDRFFLPLATQLNSRRDNADVGRWATLGLQFAHIFHHMRCLSGEKACLKESSTFGFKLNRVSRSFSTKSNEWVGERRISIAVVARFLASQSTEEQDPEKQGPVRCNSLLLLSPGSDFGHVEQCSQSPDNIARTLRLEHVRGDYVPVLSFLVLYASALDLWSQHWWHFVKAVENLRQDDDIFHHSDLHNLSTETTDADLYFDIIRLLRTAIQWVEGTSNDFDDTWASVIQASDAQVGAYHGATNRNFERVRDKLTRESKKLTDKLRQMLEDVSYLRSDLRSAAYLREVSSANRVNEHLMFLAVLTTIYLPLNFIAAVCGNSISMPFDSHLKMSGLILGALVLVALTWYFPSLHKRYLEKRSCKSCPKTQGNNSSKNVQPTSDELKLGVAYKFSLREWKTLFLGSRREKTEMRRAESKKGSCCDQGATEAV